MHLLNLILNVDCAESIHRSAVTGWPCHCLLSSLAPSVTGHVYVVVRIRNQSLYIRTAIISVIIYNDRYSWFLYIMANFFQSVYIMTEILVCL